MIGAEESDTGSAEATALHTSQEVHGKGHHEDEGEIPASSVPKGMMAKGLEIAVYGVINATMSIPPFYGYAAIIFRYVATAGNLEIEQDTLN